MEEISFSNGVGQPRIIVVGAGVVGLSTALCIKETFPNFQVSVIADKFNKETLSNGAGGLFRPEANIAPDLHLMKKWCRDSYLHFTDLISSCEGGPSGQQLVSGYHVSSQSLDILWNHLLEEILPDYREMTLRELKLFPEKFKCGVFFTTVITDCSLYLPWMEQRFQDLGGKLYCKKINCFAELLKQGECDILVNCTGLEAGKLANDFRMTPVRGQTIKVSAPWIKHFYFGNENYVIPGVNSVTLGGIKTFGNRNMNIDLHDRQFIWDGCTKLVPSLQKSRIESEWVGLRPFRQPVRVETDSLRVDSKLYKIVHNYGHGGHGVTLSWGTAAYATHLINELMRGVSIAKL